MTRWWVIRLGTRPSSPNPRPKLHGLIHMRIQMIEISTKLGSTGLKAVGNYHLQAKRIASGALLPYTAHMARLSQEWCPEC